MNFIFCGHIHKGRIFEFKREFLILNVGPKKIPVKDRNSSKGKVIGLKSSAFNYGS